MVLVAAVFACVADVAMAAASQARFETLARAVRAHARARVCVSIVIVVITMSARDKPGMSESWFSAWLAWRAASGLAAWQSSQCRFATCESRFEINF